MSGRASRSKGKIGERAAKKLLLERNYEVMQRPRGESGDDFLAVKDGKSWSVEVKHTQDLKLSHFVQCRENAHGKPRMLLWHPSHYNLPANLWVCLTWEPGQQGDVHVWRANEPR